MSFRKEIERLLTQPEISGALYYNISVIASDEGKVQWLVYSQWCGFTEDRPRREIRKARLFHGNLQREWLHGMGLPALLINKSEDIKYFYGFGGHALIIEPVAKSCFPNLIAPRVCLSDSKGLGFVDAESLTAQQLQHAPTKKLRMEVLTRDGRRCIICGRSPAYYVDVELHVHHSIPWGQGGITEQKNLITLCKTCHDGLDPHLDHGLIELLKEKYHGSSTKYFDEVKNYQSWVKAHLEKAI